MVHNNYRILAKGLLTSFFMLCVLKGLAGNAYIDSMKKVLEAHQKNDTLKVKILNRLSFSYRSIDPKETERLGFKALELSQELDYEAGIGNAYQFIGIAHWVRSNYKEAHHYIDKSIEIHKRIHDLKGLSQNYLNQGNIYKSQAKYQKAIENYFNALKNGNKLKNKRIQGKALNNIGVAYYDKQAFDKALKYYKQSLEIRREIKDKHGISSCYNNISNIYHTTGKLDSARTYLRKSLKIKRQLNDKKGIAHSLNNLGTIAQDLKQHDSALHYFQQSLAIKNTIKNDEGIVATLNNIGETYLALDKLARARDQFLKAQKIADSIGARQLELESLSYLVTADSAMGNYKDALKRQKQYKRLDDSLFSAKKSREIAAVEAKYQTAKKEAQLQRSERRTYVFAGGMALVVLIAILAIGYYKNKQQSDKLRAEKNKALANKRRQELEKEKKERELKSLIEGQETERKRIGEELHDGVGATLASLKLSITNKLAELRGYNGIPLDMKRLEKEMDEVCQEVRSISHNLMPPTLLENSLTDAIRDFINESNYTQPHLDIELNIVSDDHINNLDEKRQMYIYRITQELINNVIKHSNASKAHLQILAHKDYINILLEDNGQGFNAEQNMEGAGLKNIRSRVDILNGDMKIDSSPKTGSLFNLNIPFTS